MDGGRGGGACDREHQHVLRRPPRPRRELTQLHHRHADPTPSRAARRSASTVNRMLAAVVSFYEFHGRRGNELARDLVVRTRGGRGGFEPFLHGISRDRPRGRPVRQRLPRTLSLEQVAAVIDCQRRLPDRFLFALLASTGMRVGQALGLRHEDVVSWERRIEIVPREGAGSRSRSKRGARGSVPVPGELVRLWSDYMHEEYGALESDFVFVKLCFHCALTFLHLSRVLVCSAFLRNCWAF